MCLDHEVVRLCQGRSKKGARRTSCTICSYKIHRPLLSASCRVRNTVSVECIRHPRIPSSVESDGSSLEVQLSLHFTALFGHVVRYSTCLAFPQGMNRKPQYQPARSPKAKTEPKILVVLPAYNEAESLPSLFARFRDSAPLIGSHRILVVDDGSEDGTDWVAREAGQGQQVRVVRHASNKGLGAALCTGLLAAINDADIVVTMDADDSLDPATIPLMLSRLNEGFDIVIASRFQDGGEEVGVASHRKLLSHSASAILSLVAGVEGARDFSCGFRAYRSSFLRRLLREVGDENLVTETGFACMVELLLKASAHGARIAEVPLVLRYDRKQSASKIRVVRTIVRYAVVLTRHMASGGRHGRRERTRSRPLPGSVRQHGVS